MVALYLVFEALFLQYVNNIFMTRVRLEAKKKVIYNKIILNRVRQKLRLLLKH
jgi:hypothetical protein